MESTCSLLCYPTEQQMLHVLGSPATEPLTYVDDTTLGNGLPTEVNRTK